jgi:hypothetical protein
MARRRRRRYPYQGIRSYEDYLDAAWRGRLADLRSFRRRFGHTRVTRWFAEDPGLGRWVAHQRELHRQGELRQDRAQELQKLGFEFVLPDVPIQVPWERRHSELRAFRRRFGHARVPGTWRQDRKLARWLVKQRSSGREGKLAARAPAAAHGARVQRASRGRPVAGAVRGAPRLSAEVRPYARE